MTHDANSGASHGRPNTVHIHLGPRRTATVPPPPSFSLAGPACEEGGGGGGSGRGYSNTVSLASPHCPLTIKTRVSAGQDESALLWLPLFLRLC